MKRSTNRILTTHTGSLPRPDDLAQMVYDGAEGKPVDTDRFLARAAEAVKEAVRLQAEAGVDIVSDGEMSKVGFANYVKDRMTGFSGADKPFLALDLLEYPEVGSAMGHMPGVTHMRTPACTGPITYTGQAAVARDIATLQAALAEVSVAGAFIPAVSPGTVVQITDNQYYSSRETFLEAVADALREEYRAIVDGGFDLQVDACDLAMEGHITYGGKPLEEFRAYLRHQVDAINRATEGLPTERIRLHVCWGNYPGTHHRDRELKDFVDLVVQVRAGAFTFEAANPRHQHEWRVWKEVDLPRETVLIPGVIDTCTNYVEHPEVVAERIARFASVVGPENVIASTDCGFGTFVGMSAVAPRVAYAKLAALAQGAALASQQLFHLTTAAVSS
jgi:5-methyltetrahydropteroyltriglutamate--homocysteine methyltransferase